MDVLLYQYSDDLLKQGERVVGRDGDMAIFSSAENSFPTSTFSYKYKQQLKCSQQASYRYIHVLYNLVKFGVDSDTLLNK